MMHWHWSLVVLPVDCVTEFEVQSWHVADEVAAVAPLYLSSGHSSHPAGPIAALNFPATQSAHGPPLAPVYPSLHWHAVFTLLPASDTEFVAHVWQTVDTVALTVVEYLSATQSVQFAGPINGLNLPAAHPKHGYPFCKGMVWGQNPARHVQSVKAPLPGGDDEYCGQNSH
jgi:hypothetical protein